MRVHVWSLTAAAERHHVRPGGGQGPPGHATPGIALHGSHLGPVMPSRRGGSALYQRQHRLYGHPHLVNVSITKGVSGLSNASAGLLGAG